MGNKRLFISHISTEGHLAAALKERLESDFPGMLDIFVSSDRDTIRAGSRWLDELSAALRTTDVQFVLCSRDSVGRPWVNFEVGAAWIRDLRVIPVCHSGMTPEALPVPLSMLQAVTFAAADLRRLYDVVAEALGVTTPALDFEARSIDLRALERRAQEGDGVERVENPRVLCAATEQYAQPSLGFHLDVDIVRSVFGPERVTVDRALTRRRLTELLTGERFDVVHLVLAVDPANGDLVFGPVDAATEGAGAAGVVAPGGGRRPAERLSAAGFADLITESGTRLVVLATCNALLLAVQVSHVANMAASDTDVSGEAAAEWEDCFYHLLRQGRSVFRALELTQSQVDVPIRGIRRRDVTFAIAAAR
jgi:hypothetical protein